MKPKRIPEGLRAWIDARKQQHLSHAQVQMARELGMNPKKLGGLDNHHQEHWKLPLPVFIEELYQKRFGRAQPEFVLSIEERARQQERKKAERRERRPTAQPELAPPVDKAIEPGPQPPFDFDDQLSGVDAPLLRDGPALRRSSTPSPAASIPRTCPTAPRQRPAAVDG